MEYLQKKLDQYGRSDYYPFHMPGHKRNTKITAYGDIFQTDITEIEGFDNLHHPIGVIREAQDRAASLYHVKESFYCVNGSTAALLAAISAAVPVGKTILIARNCHKAVYHAVYLRQLKTEYLYPKQEPLYGLNEGIHPEDVRLALMENPDIRAVVITSPTYDGIVSDIRSIAEIVHSHKIPLIIDEAHGAHLGFHPYFPESAVSLGADLVVHSLHKTLPSLTQTALLHRCSDLVERSSLQKFMGIYQSSSPSYLLMGHMDECIRLLSTKKEELFSNYVDNLEKFYANVENLKNLSVVKRKQLTNRESIYDFDPSKILVSAKNCNFTGGQLYDILLSKYHLQMEMETESYIVAMTSIADQKDGFDRLAEALKQIDQSTCPDQKKIPYDMQLAERTSYTIAKAMESPAEEIEFLKSDGRISGEFVYLYPPGIPLIVPGERITDELLYRIREYESQGLHVQGLADMTNCKIQVIKE